MSDDIQTLKGTSYEEIYEVFFAKITDFDLVNLEREEILRLCKGYLRSAITKFPECEELKCRSDSREMFGCYLDDVVINVLATLMIEEWVSPRVYNILNMKQFLGDKDYTFYSQANQLEKLKELKDFANNEAQRGKVQYANSTIDISELR